MRLYRIIAAINYKPIAAYVYIKLFIPCLLENKYITNLLFHSFNIIEIISGSNDTGSSVTHSESSPDGFEHHCQVPYIGMLYA